MKIYDLNASGCFYGALATFSSSLLDKINDGYGQYIRDYARFLNERAFEPRRSHEEYCVEFLTLGMVWSRYSGASSKSPGFLVTFLRLLYRIRKKHTRMKKVIDPIRGKLTGRFIVPSIDKPHRHIQPNPATFSRLLGWLDSTGEFEHEVKRLKNWELYFGERPTTQLQESVESASGLFEWFSREAFEVLGEYVEGVKPFLSEIHPTYRGREDEIFCGKKEAEYLLNMVGAEIMNRGFADEFRKTTRRTVLLPACMRAQPEDLCRAVQTGMDICCSGCMKHCNINRMRLKGIESGFEVFIVPHTSSFTRWLKRWENNREHGIVAVACLLNIVVGGYEMRELQIPSQCVPLNYSGCKKHWHEQGIPTTVNEERVVALATAGN